ncbi:hypothetical protein NPIL_45651 [Nephila pilipes]|uniref:Uncharacterized protein n=1 Tax=Nephila pilipes TaxID=299642 RepID=A0A8X6UTW7_NEPPI|nr:hypothetical protein NPIL_45651 [Nephila pilipes]
METTDSNEFPADESSITCFLPNPGQIIDKENNLNEVEPVDVCREEELNFKQHETLEKKIASKKRCLNDNSFSSDEDIQVIFIA